MGLGKFFTFLFLIFIIIAGFLIQDIMQHEATHQIIFKSYGIDSNVTYNFWNAFKSSFNFNIDKTEPWAWTTPSSNTTHICNETCNALHSELEISEDQTINICLSLFSIFILYILYKEIFSGNFKDIKDD